MLTAAELADIRSVAALALPDRATISRRSLASDGHLGQAETWTPIASDVPCRVVTENKGTPNSAAVGARDASTGNQAVRLVYGTNLREGDRITVVANGHTHTFEAVRVLETSYATVLTVAVSEVR